MFKSQHMVEVYTDPCVDVEAGIEQQLHHLAVTVASSEMEGRVFVDVVTGQRGVSP